MVSGGFSSPCKYFDEALITVNSLFDSDPVRNDQVLCATKL
ncbi:hypothetical protein [Streptomyces sp. NPDC048411]